MMKQNRRRRVTFKLDAPEAKRVYVTGDFAGWNPKAVRMKRTATGEWRVGKFLAPGEYQYRFVVDGEWTDDPSCQERVYNEFGTQNCILRVN